MSTTGTATPAAATPAGAASGAPRPTPGQRLVSLDAFRGFTMFWLLGGKPFLMAISGLSLGAFSNFLKYELTHTPWVGLRYYDLIWPSFMLMVGVSIPFSFARERNMARVWRRAIVLFLLGSLRESMSTGTPCLIELSSALQPIAVAYLVASYLAVRSVRAQIATAAAILMGYALLLAFVPAPGIPAGTYEANHNLVTVVDQAVIGRAHPEGWGTALSTIPTISTTILGLLFGELLMASKGSRHNAKVIGLTGLGCLVSGLALSPFIPVIMKMWTTSYGFVSAGWACLLFLTFYWTIDVLGYRGWTLPLVVIGVNALAAYLGPTIVQVHRMTDPFIKPIAARTGAFGPVLSTGSVLLVSWLVLFWMYRRKIVLRA
jgi:predicted acyltransferase